MDQDTGNKETISARNHPRITKKEKYHQNRSKLPGSTPLEKAIHQRGFTRTITHNITNISKHQLTPGEISLLSIGLNFIPT